MICKPAWEVIIKARFIFCKQLVHTGNNIAFFSHFPFLFLWAKSICEFNPLNRCPKNIFSTVCLNMAKGSLCFVSSL